MAGRKEMKQAALAEVARQREARRARKAELAAMSPDERQAARLADKAAARQAKADVAERRQAMTPAERRADKRQARVVRKIRNRPGRAIGWSALAVGVLVLALLVGPIVGDIARLTSLTVTTDSPAGVAAREHGMTVSERVADEGIVLLRNEGDVLPLTEGRVNVFSFASFNLRYGGGGSGASDASAAVTLYDALKGQGIEYNPQLHQAMEAAGATTESGSSSGLVQVLAGMVGGGDKGGEPAPDYLTDEVMAQAVDYADTAMIVIGNDGVEMQDFTPEQLRLNDEVQALITTVTASFDKVVLVVNAGNIPELAFLDSHPQIKGVLWMGTPGPRGAVSLAKVLKGDINPSGRITSTLAHDVTSAPAAENFGDYGYSNAKRAFLNYEEGIYVGYRYYETRYTGDEEGYRQAVQFPFGSGQGYSDFTWSDITADTAGDDVTLSATVTNAGQVAGKDVVQAYFSAPYTPGGIEKSAIELGGYAKTAELAPGASETVKITFPKRDMASWDADGQQAYVLEAGTYTLSVSRTVHDPVQRFDLAVPAAQVFTTDEVTGTRLENRFGDAEGDLTYLSRSDWEGTYPSIDDTDHVAGDAVLSEINYQITPAEGTAPTYGATNNLMLGDLRGLAFDDPAWDQFLDQLTLEEQVDLFSRGAYTTTGIDRLGIPKATLLDGPAGLNSFFSSMVAAAYPTEVVVASTWNDALAYELGNAVGAEANAFGVQGWYAPGMNLHRTALGGRNFEYFSEDPLVSGRMGASMVKGAQDRGVLTFMKHFIVNDQEINARTGVNVWADEQALRELYLRPFEITVKEGGANGVMSSFIHVGPSWSGGNTALLQGVLRGEWGFDGLVSTDAVLGSFMDPVRAALNGNDLMLAPMPSGTVKTMKAAVKADPVGVGAGLRDRVHQVCYSLLQTDLFD